MSTWFFPSALVQGRMAHNVRVQSLSHCAERAAARDAGCQGRGTRCDSRRTAGDVTLQGPGSKVL